MLQGLTFLTPWALAAIAALPVIWWLLRFTPPKPQHVRFPPLRLLLELVPREEQPDKTPWWLLLLRLALAAFLILAVAHPLLVPSDATRLAGNPLLVVVDDSWAAAKDWDRRLAVLQDLAATAQQAGVPVTIAATSPTTRPADLTPQAAHDAESRITASHGITSWSSRGSAPADFSPSRSNTPRRPTTSAFTRHSPAEGSSPTRSTLTSKTCPS